MGAKTKTVGGGAAKPLAGDWNKFLQQTLSGGGTGGMNQSMNNGPMSGVAQTQGFAGAMNNMLGGGRMTTPNEMSSELSQLRGMQMNPANLPGQRDMQTFGGVQYQGMPGQQNLGFNPNAGMGGGAQQVNAQQSFDPRMLLSGMGMNPQAGGLGSYGIPGLAGQAANGGLNPEKANLGSIQQMLSGNGQAMGAQQFQTGGADMNGQTAQSIMQMGQQSLDRNVADLRARFGASGGASFGTPAAMAEADMRAQAIPQMMAQLGQLNQQEAGLQNQNNALNLQSILGTAGANQGNVSSILGALGLNQQGTLGQGQLQNAGTGTALSAMLGLRGQDADMSGQNLQALLQSRGMDINQLNAFANAAQGQDQLGMQAQLANQAAGLQGRGLDLQQMQQNMQNALGNRGMEMDFMNQLNQLGMQQRGQDINSFLSQTGMNNDLLGMNMNGQLQNNAQLMQLMGMRGQMAQGVDGFNQQNAAMQNQNIMGILNQLFGSFQQSNALGTPQAQMIQKPSAFGQAMGALGGIAGAIPGIGTGIQAGMGMLGGLFGGGGAPMGTNPGVGSVEQYF
jgi:hypothetical protein